VSPFVKGFVSLFKPAIFEVKKAFPWEEGIAIGFSQSFIKQGFVVLHFVESYSKFCVKVAKYFSHFAIPLPTS